MTNHVSELEMRERLGRELAKEVHDQGRKYNWLAAKAGVDESYLGAVLRGQQVGSLTILIKVGKVIGLDLSMEWIRK
jgi:cell division FtsZ-interacting protein ZapD